MTPGTKIEVFITHPGGAVTHEPAKIARWTKVMGRREDLPGFHAVRFADGGCTMIHESGFRAVGGA